LGRSKGVETRGDRAIRIAIGGVAVLVSLHAVAQTSVRFQHEWRFEGHVAPFLVALDRGYYQAEGLNVIIDPDTPRRSTASTASPRAPTT